VTNKGTTQAQKILIIFKDALLSLLYEKVIIINLLQKKLKIFIL
jgi:hypothetical protein